MPEVPGPSTSSRSRSRRPGAPIPRISRCPAHRVEATLDRSPASPRPPRSAGGGRHTSLRSLCRRQGCRPSDRSQRPTGKAASAAAAAGRPSPARRLAQPGRPAPHAAGAAGSPPRTDRLTGSPCCLPPVLDITMAVSLGAAPLSARRRRRSVSQLEPSHALQVRKASRTDRNASAVSGSFDAGLRCTAAATVRSAPAASAAPTVAA